MRWVLRLSDHLYCLWVVVFLKLDQNMIKLLDKVQFGFFFFTKKKHATNIPLFIQIQKRHLRTLFCFQFTQSRQNCSASLIRNMLVSRGWNKKKFDYRILYLGGILGEKLQPIKKEFCLFCIKNLVLIDRKRISIDFNLCLLHKYAVL